MASSVRPRIWYKNTEPKSAWLPASLDCSNLEVRTDVSDEELREAYRSAWGLLMPITDATANNSILEAAACGTPIIATDIGGVRDYVPESAGLLCRGDADTYVDAVRQLIDQPSLRDSLGASARRNAETLAWPGVRAALLAAICEIDWCSRSDGKTSATWTTLRTR